MINWLHNLVRRVGLALSGPHDFVCGPIEQCVEFVGKGGRKAKIWLKQPDGDVKFRYQYHLVNKLTEAQLRDFESADNKIEKAHQLQRHDRDFRFFDEIYSRCDGYRTQDGCDLSALPTGDQVAHLKKWWPNHVETAVQLGIDPAESIAKKKS